MENYSKLILKVTITVVAFTFSAFTQSKVNHLLYSSNHSLILFNYLVQRVSDEFTPLDNSNPLAEPDYMMCAGSATHDCIYSITLLGKIFIPNQSSYTSSQIDSYLANHWLQESISSVGALYWD